MKIKDFFDSVNSGQSALIITLAVFSVVMLACIICFFVMFRKKDGRKIAESRYKKK